MEKEKPKKELTPKQKFIKAIKILKEYGFKIKEERVSENIAHLAPKSQIFFDLIRSGMVILEFAIPVVFEEKPEVYFASWWEPKKRIYVNIDTEEVWSTFPLPDQEVLKNE